MAKKIQNLKPSTVLKNYWSDNEQFADLFNAVLFGGRQIIRPEELEDLDTEESTVLTHREYAESIGASRDNIKIQKKSTAFGMNDLKLHNMNNKDLFNLMGILLDKNKSRNEARKETVEYVQKYGVDKSVIMTVAGAANCKIDYNMLVRKGDADMWSVFEETRTEGRAEEIVETGYEFGLSENDILERLQNKLNVSLQKAQEYLQMFGKQTV